MTTRKTSSTASPPPLSLAAWQARAVHTITCPSGQRLRIRIPGVATLIERGDLPDDLLEIALAEVTHADGAAGSIAEEFAANGDGREKQLARLHEFASFQKHLVCAAVCETETAREVWQQVTLTPADIDALPEDDLAMVAEIVQRLRSTDALGVRVGVEPLDRWAMFRDTHKDICCAGDESCAGCQKLVRMFSSVDVGAV